MSSVYKQGRNKTKLKHQTAFLPFEDDPCSFSYPVCFSFNNLGRYLFWVCLAFSQISIVSCIVQWLKYVILIFPGLHCSYSLYSPKKKVLEMVYLLGGDNYLCWFCCMILVHSSNDISLFILHFHFDSSLSQPAKAMPEFCCFPIGFGKQTEQIKSKSLNFL